MATRLFLLFAMLTLGLHAARPTIAEDRVRFDRDIRPILSDKCYFCHGPDKGHRKAELRLDLEQAAKASVIVPGDINNSELVRRIHPSAGDEMMPPRSAKKTLKREEIELLTRWVDQGAEWTEHWAFVAPVRPNLPDVGADDEIVSPIDRFVLQRLAQEGLQQNPLADRRTLIRRVTFDLTGLPPTPEEILAFVDDTSPDAYEKVVDRLLQSPHYGERTALAWLDAARYGDTSVFHADGPRDMWAWRDLVVKSFNENQPFDQFSIEQLAGDLLADATVEQQVASGFNRNNGTTDEGGAIAEEYRVEYAVDRVKTTSTVWLGLTMECAQCHDHKYDPISQEEYYQFYAYFNVSADAGMQTRGGNAKPIVEVPDPEKQRKLPQTRESLASVQKQMDEHVAAVGPALGAWIQQQEAALANDEVEQLPSDPLLHFALDDGKGDAATDSVDAARKAKIKGNADWKSARFEKGLRLDGKSYLDVGALGDFQRTDSFSYGGWVRPDGKPTGVVWARMDNNNAFRGYDMLLSDGHVEVHIVHKWPDNAIKVRTKKRLEADQWQHVFATYDGSSKVGGVTIYIDGEAQEVDVQQDGLVDTIRTKKSLLIGSRHPDSRFKGTLDELRMYGRALTCADVAALAAASPVKPVLRIATADRTDEQREQLQQYFLANVDQAYRSLVKEQEKLQAQEKELLKPLTTVMIMRNMEKPRDTFLLSRGSYESPTDLKVLQGTPTVLPPISSDAPKNRLSLARWLFREDHPLTARVTVNRIWQMLFGTGLVATPEDFGAQGAFPSHPELLDWLAVDFRESGWDVKRMIKRIVMSRTYRQSTTVAPHVLNRDPNNRLMARGPRFRLQGEFIRDNAMAISGLLNRKLGGPGVKPYQPPGLWAEVGLGGNPKFVQDHGDKLYRRSIYTYWKRSAPPPSMQIFDAPTREKCTVRRARTNTPLQALVTLNDVQFVEASRHLAERIMREAGESPQQRIAFAYLLATAREPSDTDTDALLHLYESAHDFYANENEAAKKLLSSGESPRDESLDITDHAAWTIVASAILNLDETLTRG